MGRRVVRAKPLNAAKSQSIRNYYDNRNKILIIREVGGLGDILMHRMMFEGFQAICPDFKIVFACPAIYHDAVRDHPYLDELLDSATVNQFDYTMAFNTTSSCGRYEMKLSPLSDLHRSDIWSRSCGITLKNHNMHIKLSEEELAYGRDLISKIPGASGKPSVAFCPISAMLGKNMNRNQIGGVLEGLKRRGLAPFGLHKSTIVDIDELKYPMITGLSIRQWMSVIASADYVISVDTASFHCAGGLGKPMVGVFSFADGKVYGRYYDNWELVQKHRDNGDWECGPCYNWSGCSKDSVNVSKPCMTQISSDDILTAFDRLLEKHTSS